MKNKINGLLRRIFSHSKKEEDKPKIPDSGLRIMVLSAYKTNYHEFLKTNDDKYLKICVAMEDAYMKCGGTKKILEQIVEEMNNKQISYLKKNN